MLTMQERCRAIRRARRALAAVAADRRSSRAELGRAREHLNVCYAQAPPTQLWAAVARVGAMTSLTSTD